MQKFTTEQLTELLTRQADLIKIELEAMKLKEQLESLVNRPEDFQFSGTLRLTDNQPAESQQDDEMKDLIVSTPFGARKLVPIDDGTVNPITSSFNYAIEKKDAIGILSILLHQKQQQIQQLHASIEQQLIPVMEIKLTEPFINPIQQLHS